MPKKLTLVKDINHGGGYNPIKVINAFPNNVYGNPLKVTQSTVINPSKINLPPGTVQPQGNSYYSPPVVVTNTPVIRHRYENIYSPRRLNRQELPYLGHSTYSLNNQVGFMSTYGIHPMNPVNRLVRFVKGVPNNYIRGKYYQRVKNVTGVVIYKDSENNNERSVLLVRDKIDKQWMTPAGGLESGETPWKAFKREFKEETGKEFNENDIKNKKEHEYHRRDITVVYVIEMKTPININKFKPVSTSETDDAKLVKIGILYNNIIGNSGNLKSYVRDSLHHLFKYGYLV